MQNIWIFIWRLNPPHIWHIKVLKTSLKNNEKTILFFWSTNLIDEKNPFLFEERKTFIEKIFKKEIFSKKLIIDYLEDSPSDELWTQKIWEKINSHINTNNSKITFFWWDFENDSAILVIKKYLKCLKIENINFFEVYRKKILLPNGEEISSTQVRNSLNAKDLKKAKMYLPYGLKWVVINMWKRKFFI